MTESEPDAADTLVSLAKDLGSRALIHRRSSMRFDLRKDPRYEWLNAEEGQAAEYQIYRRVGSK